ncbi:Hypothetical predicted protein, partial [Marmota monax]
IPHQGPKMNPPPIKFLRKLFYFLQPLHLPGRCSVHPRHPSGDPPRAAAKAGRFDRVGAGGCRGSGRLPPQLGGLPLARTRAGRLNGGGRRGRGRRRQRQQREGIGERSGPRNQAARAASAGERWRRRLAQIALAEAERGALAAAGGGA